MAAPSSTSSSIYDITIAITKKITKSPATLGELHIEYPMGTVFEEIATGITYSLAGKHSNDSQVISCLPIVNKQGQNLVQLKEDTRIRYIF